MSQSKTNKLWVDFMKAGKERQERCIVNRTKIDWCDLDEMNLAMTTATDWPDIVDWADYSWNPVVGCSGQGCSGAFTWCYAQKMAHRFHRDFTPHWVERNFQRAMPKEPSRIFVNSMSDVADWKPEWLAQVMQRIHEHTEHLFLFLSKQPWEVPGWIDWPNAMLGYTATDQLDYDRLVPHCTGRVSFLSFEPLLGPIKWYDSRWTPRWIIVGAETGNRKERVVPDPGWILDIYEYVKVENDIPLFFKESLRSLWPFDGYDYFPQEYPAWEKIGPMAEMKEERREAGA
jgi:protein gp37